MSSVPELQLSQSFKLAQRAFASLLDAAQFDASLAMAGRVRMAALDKLDLRAVNAVPLDSLAYGNVRTVRSEAGGVVASA